MAAEDGVVRATAVTGEVLALCAALAACATSAPCPPASPRKIANVASSSAGLSGSESGVVFRNEMSDSYRMTRVLIVLDHRVLYNREAGTGRAPPSLIFLRLAAQTPGEHELQILVQIRGHGEGDCSYLSDYRFEVKSSHRLTAVENRAMQVEVVVLEKSLQDAPFSRLPAIHYIDRNTPTAPPLPQPKEAVPAATSEVPAGAPSTQAPAP